MIPTMKKHLPSEIRGQQLLDVAVALASKGGLSKLTREAIAVKANVSPGLVSVRLGTMANLRRAIMRQAVAREDLKLLAEGLVMRDPVVMRAPAELRARAAAALGV